MAATEKVKNNDKPKDATPKDASTAASKPAAGGPPAGYKKSATEAVGFFDGSISSETNGLHFVPLHVVLGDSSIDKTKPNALVFGRLIEPCACIRSAEAGDNEAKLKERPLVTTKKDDVVAVWFSAGMRDLAYKFGVPTYMYYEGEKKIKGKPSPMKAFAVLSPKEGTQLPVREDRRLHSAGVEAKPFAGKKLAGASDTVDTGDGEGSDDIPF